MSQLKSMMMAIGLMLSVFAAPVLAHGQQDHASETSQKGGTEVSAITDGSAASPPSKRGAVDDQSTVNDGASDDASSGLLAVIQKLHPATVHFPIALFLMAALTEIIAIARPSQGLSAAVRIMIYGGAAGAILAASFGWIHTGIWFGGDTNMQIHRWTGTAIAIAGVILASLASRKKTGRLALRVTLFGIAGAIFIQGYLGGELANGPNHLGL